tara:strand:- start:301 stop:513 length:213 start_codon:yes stop_codon:yes gene_type:complete
MLRRTRKRTKKLKKKLNKKLRGGFAYRTNTKTKRVRNNRRYIRGNKSMIEKKRRRRTKSKRRRRSYKSVV